MSETEEDRFLFQISGTLDTAEVMGYSAKAAFSFYNIIYYTVAFTLFGWLIMFLTSDRNVLFPEVMLVALVALLFSLILNAYSVYASWRGWKQMPNPDCRYSIGEERIVVQTDDLKSDISWKSFKHATETRQGFTLFIDGDEAPMLIPKRFFSNSSEVDRFRELLKRRDLLINQHQ